MSGFRFGNEPLRGRTWLWMGLTVVVVCLLAIVLPLLGNDSADDKDEAVPEVPTPILPSVVPAPPTPTPPAPTPPAPTPGGQRLEGPELVRWGGNGDQLSLVVKNTSDVEVVRARVLITALAADRSPIATTTGDPTSTCCTVVGLRPGGEFGLFMDLPVPVSEVDDVIVRYVDPETAASGPDDAAWVEATALDLIRTADDAVVVARLESHGAVGPFVAGQAFLVDSDDRLVGVISGRFYCFTPETPRRVRMELQRPVPQGTRISKVLAFPVPEGTPTGVARECS